MNAVLALPWAWPLCETFHFIGLCLLIGIVGMFDLRVLGVAKELPLTKLIAGTSLFLWIGVVVFGRLIPRGSNGCSCSRRVSSTPCTSRV